MNAGCKGAIAMLSVPWRRHCQGTSSRRLLFALGQTVPSARPHHPPAPREVRARLQLVYIAPLPVGGLRCYTGVGVMSVKNRVLIVEDDPAISRLMESNLLVAGYAPVCAMDGRQALDTIAAHPFDLALCDVMLPELDGFELLPYLRERGIPVIYVSAKADVPSRVQGLRLGAEDYLVKPFDILELLVRMEKVLARSAPAESRLVYQDVTVDLDSRLVSKGQEPVALKPMEYELLCMFMKHPGMVLTREKLLRQVWGDAYIGETRTVDVHVAALRKKLSWNDQLVTVYKLGYRLEVPA